MVEVGGVTERFDALAAGVVDATLVAPPLDEIGQQRGMSVAMRVQELAPAYPGLGIVASRGKLDTAVEPVAAYLAALDNALGWMRGADPGDVAAELAAAGFGPAAARSVLATIPRTLAPASDGLAALIRLRQETGMVIAGAPAPADLIDPRPLRVAWPATPRREEPLMPEAVIVATARPPIGRAYKGSLRDLRPDDLAVQMVHAVLAAANRFCASSLQAIRMAAHAVKAGEGEVFIAVGVEAVSRYEQCNADSHPGTENPRFAVAQARTRQVADGVRDWSDPWADGEPDSHLAMGQTAENVAALERVSRAEQDAYAVRSRNSAEKGIADGFWGRDITPATLPDGTLVTADDCPRPGVTLEAVAALKAAFRPDGMATAGNACPLNDGAAAVVVMSDVEARQLGLTPLARDREHGASPRCRPRSWGSGRSKRAHPCARRGPA